MEEQETDGVHRLEAPKPQTGGLIIKKAADKKDDVFKVPKYGLDLLAKKLRKERENSSLLSFKSTEEEDENKESTEADNYRPSLSSAVTKNYRSNVESTPGSSASETVKKYKETKKQDERRKGLYSSSKKKEERDRGHRRSRDDRSDRRRRDYSDRSDRSDHRNRRGEPATPGTPGQYRYGDRGSSRSNWDEEDFDHPDRKKSRSAWDCPTPKLSSSSRHHGERSSRSTSGYNSAQHSSRRRREDDSTRVTPAYKYNKWATDRRESGATPRVDGKQDEDKRPWEDDDADREAWEEEQKRLDREWYNLDEGFDEEVANEDSEYLKKREEANEAKRKKKVSAHQRQINKDNELWEKNRMLTSGVVTSINVNEDFEEESVERVHLLVHHTIPPFLDGRIVFTKVMGKLDRKAF